MFFQLFHFAEQLSWHQPEHFYRFDVHFLGNIIILQLLVFIDFDFDVYFRTRILYHQSSLCYIRDRFWYHFWWLSTLDSSLASWKTLVVVVPNDDLLVNLIQNSWSPRCDGFFFCCCSIMLTDFFFDFFNVLIFRCGISFDGISFSVFIFGVSNDF